MKRNIYLGKMGTGLEDGESHDPLIPAIQMEEDSAILPYGAQGRMRAALDAALVRRGVNTTDRQFNKVRDRRLGRGQGRPPMTADSGQLEPYDQN